MAKPDAGTVQLYVWNYQQFDDREYSTFQKMLSAAELERNQTFSQAIHRRRDAICRGLLRRHLGRMLQKPAHQIPLVTSKNGKPSLHSENETLHFNYSHSADVVAFAFCVDAEVGIDIEFTPRNNNLLGIATHFFAPAEVAALTALPESEQRQRFFQYWTLKEAYLKARGEGIFLGLDKFSFEPGFCADETIEINFVNAEFDTPRQWQFHALQLLAEYQVSVAVRDASRKKLLIEKPQGIA